MLLISYCGWWITAWSCICFGHSSHFVAQIYTHHFIIIPIGYVLMHWNGRSILSTAQAWFILSSLFWKFHNNGGRSLLCMNLLFSKWLKMITTMHSNTERSLWKSERESFFFGIVPLMVCCLYAWMACTSAVDKRFAMYPSVSIVILVH